MDKELMKNLIRGNYKRSPEMDGDACPGEKVNMFSVESETSICKFWNSSNNSSFNKKEACSRIVSQILEDEDDEVYDGSFSIDFNEIMFEIRSK